MKTTVSTYQYNKVMKLFEELGYCEETIRLAHVCVNFEIKYISKENTAKAVRQVLKVNGIEAPITSEDTSLVCKIFESADFYATGSDEDLDSFISFKLAKIKTEIYEYFSSLNYKIISYEVEHEIEFDFLDSTNIKRAIRNLEEQLVFENSRK